MANPWKGINIVRLNRLVAVPGPVLVRWRGGGGDASSPPPPPPPNGYTVGGTVSGLAGSGLTLELCSGNRQSFKCHSSLQVGANRAFTFDSIYPAGYSGAD